MLALRTPCVSSLIHAELLGEIHLTNGGGMVEAGPASPLFWKETTRDDNGRFSCICLGIDHALVATLCPPHALKSAAAIRLWATIAAPALIAASVADIILFRPALWLASGLAQCLFRLAIPRSVRWWEDEETPPKTGAEG